MGLDRPVSLRDSAMAPFPVAPRTTGLVGTAGTGVTAIETGEGTRHRTLLLIATDTVVGVVADTAALGSGALIYTFPAGQVIIERVYGDIGLDVDENAYDEDTPEVGLGTVIATGAIGTLGAGSATMEDIWGPHVVAGCDTKAVAADAGQFVTVPNLIIAGASVHTVFLNIADTWANGTGTPDVTVENGRFVIDWTLMPIEGI